MNLSDFVLQVEIFPEDVTVLTRSGESSGGKKWVTHQQKGYFKRPQSRFPIEFLFSLKENSLPYSAGLYLLDPSSFASGDFDSLELSRFNFKLIPVPDEFLELSVGSSGR